MDGHDMLGNVACCSRRHDSYHHYAVSRATVTCLEQTTAMNSTKKRTVDAAPMGSVIASEIEKVEKALKENGRKQMLLNHTMNHEGRYPSASQDQLAVHDDPLVRLSRLERTADDLMLAQEIKSWMQDREAGSGSQLLSDCLRFSNLASLLIRHASTVRHATHLFRKVFEEEYLPFYEYLCDELIVLLGESLRAANYPERSSELLRQAVVTIDRPGDEGSGGTGPDAKAAVTICMCCNWRISIESVHSDLLQSLHKSSDGGSEPSGLDRIVLELWRPFVGRLRFHFLDEDETRLSSSRIERLPDLLFGYFREHVFAPGGVWDWIADGLVAMPWVRDGARINHIGKTAMDNSSSSRHSLAAQPRSALLIDLPLCFLNELVRIVQWIFGERVFFRHRMVAGPESNPIVITNAIEQLLQFDDFLQKLVQGAYFQTSSPNEVESYRRRLLSMTDVFVAGDDELMRWWLQQEREAALGLLFADSADASLLHRMSPRAELFCALMVSIQTKASVFSFSGPYLNQVAAPLCMHFLDAVHETATDLKGKLQQRRMLSDGDLYNVVNKWIELINGTNLAAQVLSDTVVSDADTALADDDAQAMNASRDIDRFGRSLQNLCQVLTDDFCTAFVECLLMERTKFALYLMRCPHLLCEDSDIDLTHSLSPDLRETARVMRIFLGACERTSRPSRAQTYGRQETHKEVDDFAAGRLRDGVVTLVSEKLLEVAMNYQGMTPDLFDSGCNMFAQDVNSIFASSRLPITALRLLDIARAMATDSASLVRIGGVLCGLAGMPAPLPEDTFMGDERLHEEATSMIRAKGFVFLAVEDIISVLNRRRDLRSPSRTTSESVRNL
jgi:hypothetical protein